MPFSGVYVLFLVTGVLMVGVCVFLPKPTSLMSAGGSIDANSPVVRERVCARESKRV